jgi:hypothetical protein
MTKSSKVWPCARSFAGDSVRNRNRIIRNFKHIADFIIYTLVFALLLVVIIDHGVAVALNFHRYSTLLLRAFVESVYLFIYLGICSRKKNNPLSSFFRWYIYSIQSPLDSSTLHSITMVSANSLLFFLSENRY